MLTQSETITVGGGRGVLPRLVLRRAAEVCSQNTHERAADAATANPSSSSTSSYPSSSSLTVRRPKTCSFLPKTPSLSWADLITSRGHSSGRSDHLCNLKQFNPPRCGAVRVHAGEEQLLTGGQCLSPGRLCRRRPLVSEPPREPGDI